jgi:manganese/zinc/iron transport system permease protein
MGNTFHTILQLLSDANVQFALSGTVLLAVSAGIVGTFSFLRKQSLVGDAVAHAVLPGIVLMFMATSSKSILLLLIGAGCTSWLAVRAIGYLAQRTKLKEDTSVAVVLSVFFGIGMFLLTFVQHSGAGNQAGLDKFLFGKAASLIGDDILLFSGITTAILLAVALLFKELMLITFDPVFATSSGIKVNLVESILTIMTVAAVVLGIQAVGVVLMASLLITPSATARYWTDSLRSMMLIAISSSVISSVGGVLISALNSDIPTGPAIVMMSFTVFILSVLFAPSRGILARAIRRNAHQKSIAHDNILKRLYHLHEKTHSFNSTAIEGTSMSVSKQGWTIDEINPLGEQSSASILRLLRTLEREGYVIPSNHIVPNDKNEKTYESIRKSATHWQLTKEGLNRGARITRLHRLWEVYLTQQMNLASDHVHDDAESVEHFITPELESELERFLDYPELDPHQKAIPYSKTSR